MIKTILKAAVYSAAIAFTAWAAISFFDVISNNLTSCDYWKYNLFIMLSAIKGAML